MNRFQPRLSRRAFGRDLVLTAAGVLVFRPGTLLAGEVTPRQTEGPFYPDFEAADTDLDLTLIEGHSATALGQHILVRGRITDASGAPVSGAVVDIWQANDAGRYRHAKDPNPAALDPNFQGWGIVRTDADGQYRFKTIMPGVYSLDLLGGSGFRARHIHYKIGHADYLPLTTQQYFPGDPLIEQDGEFNRAPEEDRWRLISSSESADSSGLPVYRFDVVLAAA